MLMKHIVVCLGVFVVFTSGIVFSKPSRLSCENFCSVPMYWSVYPMESCSQTGKTLGPNTLCPEGGLSLFWCYINTFTPEQQGIQYPGPCGCPNLCSNSTLQGSCVSDRCECNEGYGGEDCSLVTMSNTCKGAGDVLLIGDDDDDELDDFLEFPSCHCSNGIAGNDCGFRVGTLPPIVQTLPDTQYTSKDNYNNSSPIFNDTTIAQVHLLTNGSSLDYMFDPVNQEEREYFPADFWFYNGVVSQTYANVGFRLKGGFSRKLCKKSWKISFNEYVSGTDWAQQTKLELKGMTMDNSAIHEKVCLSAYYSMNAIVQRGSYAQVYFNYQNMGMYIMLENIDKHFLNSRFGNDNGQLYKCTGTLQWLGPNPQSYKNSTHYQPETDAAEDYVHLIEFIDILNNSPDDKFVSEIESIFDVDLFIRTLVAEVATGQSDGIWNGNNYYLYYNYDYNKFQFFRHDLDVAFGLWDTQNPMIERNIYTWGVGSRGEILIQRILDVYEYQVAYTNYFLQFLDSYFSFKGSFIPRAQFLINEISYGMLQDKWHELDFGFTYEQFHDSMGSGITFPLTGPLSKLYNSTILHTYAMNEFIERRISSANQQILQWRTDNQ